MILEGILSKREAIESYNKYEIKQVTAAIDGISDCPGEPCETSIPRIIVGTFETIGMDGECSTANKELSPPSCKRCEKLARNMQHLKT